MKNMTADSKKEAMKEAEIMINIDHPHILKGIQYGDDSIVYPKSWKKKNKNVFFVVTELA